ncbi:Uu.00g041670.m01.CDS01 [Anthostomella pinea]|uniref:Uu.00g041670.m01.CDS01 n=1 Tax=Anthostomella pinea TaxID=933095 RepID=A0AAI8YBM9_9PEZI|nr:Uu.00g041670.m01.CDS01 [Anthostomella pinea]
MAPGEMPLSPSVLVLLTASEELDDVGAADVVAADVAQLWLNMKKLLSRSLEPETPVTHCSIRQCCSGLSTTVRLVQRVADLAFLTAEQALVIKHDLGGIRALWLE